MVYFIQQGHSGPVKIGYSSNPRKRIQELQTGSAERLYLLGSIEGDKTKENTLQNYFRKDKMQGEWFKPSDSLMDYILSLIVGPIDSIKIAENIDLDSTLEALEKRIILSSLIFNQGNQTKAAKALNITVRAIRHRIKKYNLSNNRQA